MVDNDYYVLTQQDVRKIEDTRFLSISKVNKNGTLNPIDPTVYEYLLHLLKYGNINVICQNRVPEELRPQPMEQQLNWDKYSNTSTPVSILSTVCY